MTIIKDDNHTTFFETRSFWKSLSIFSQSRDELGFAKNRTLLSGHSRMIDCDVA